MTLSTSSVPSFRFSTSEIAKGRRSTLSGHPSDVIRSNGRSSRRSPPRRGMTVKPAKAYGKSAPPNMQRLLASKKTVAAARVVRTATFQSKSSMGVQGNGGGSFVSD